MKFHGKTIFITGANRGIGSALVEATLKRGAAKIYAAARDTQKLPKFNDDRIIPITLDITKEDQISEAVNATRDTQILINNAGVIHHGGFIEGDIDGFYNDMEVNYFSTLRMMRAFLPTLKKNNDSRIVNIVSITKFVSWPFITGYAASKCALYSVTQAARIELSQYGIAVHAVNPGAIDTDMNTGSEMEMTSPDEVAESILNAIEREVLDIVPDKIGKGMLAIWEESPMKLEKAAQDMFFSMDRK